MYYEFHIDVFFLENMVMDYIVLWMTGKILRRERKRLRMLLAALLGASGACVLMISPVRKIPILALTGYAVTAFLMVRVGFGISQKRMLVKSGITLAGTAFLMGGIFQTAVSWLPLPVLVLAFISAGTFRILLKGYQSTKFGVQNYYEVTLGLHGKTVSVRGLRDTGNQLKAPVTGKPVSILSYDAVKDILDQEAKICYIPYHSIGKSSGLLPGIIFDYMSIRQEGDSRRWERPVIAVSKEPVNRDGKYQMILHPALLDN